MHDHCHKNEVAEDKSDSDRVILLGNANVGKSVIFGLLTGKYATVSNYPGTTVEVTHGNLNVGDKKYHLIDTPGTSSLVPMSEDERVTRDILLKHPFHSVVQVADAKNMKRTLMLTLQLAETGRPMILVLNMWDESTDRGIQIDTKKLSSMLGVHVISAIAPQKKGVNQIRAALQSPKIPSLTFSYDARIEKALEKISCILPSASISGRTLALMILSGAPGMNEWLTSNLAEEEVRQVESIVKNLQKHFERPLSEVLSSARLAKVEQIFADVVTKTEPGGGKILQLIGRYSTHPVWGVPILLAVLYAIWLFVGDFGAGVLVDFLETVIFGAYLNPWAERLASLIPVVFLRDLLVGPYGVITMALTYAIAIILPITGTFFIAFGILEDSGYLPRLAVMTNRIFNFMGLNGKAVLPMVLGLGCVTMATMTTRILETKRERVIATFLLALAVPCSAQLGVIMGLLSSLSYKVTVIWLLSVTTTLILLGWLASMVLKGEKPALFLDLPPIRMPRMSNVLLKTLGRTEWYLREAVPLFIIGTLTLFFLDRFHLLLKLRDLMSPIVVTLLGLPEEATDAFIMGFLRRDYGAAGFFEMSKKGMLTPIQVTVALVTITLFVPCLANLLMMIKERGLKSAMTMLGIVMSFAIAIGGALNFIIRFSGIRL